MKSIADLMQEVKASTVSLHGKEASGSSPAESASDPTEKGNVSQPSPDAPKMPGENTQNGSSTAPSLPGGTELVHSGGNPQPSGNEPMEDFQAKVAGFRTKLAGYGMGAITAPASVPATQQKVAAPGAAPAASVPAPAPAAAPAATPGASAAAPVMKLANYQGVALNTLTAFLLESERGPFLMKQALDERLGLEEAENLIKQASAEVIEARRLESLGALQEISRNEWLAKCASDRQARQVQLQTKLASVQDETARTKIANSQALFERARAGYENLPDMAPEACDAFDYGLKMAAAMMEAEAAGGDPAAAVGPEEGAPATPEEILEVVAMLAQAGLIPPESVEQIVAAVGGGGAPGGEGGAPPAGPEGGMPPGGAPPAGPEGGAPPPASGSEGPPPESEPPKDKEAAIDEHLQKVANFIFTP